MARLSERHRLLYAGLWTLADREGRLKDEPDWIKAELFPYEGPIDVDSLLTDLQHAEFIVRYTYGDNSKTRTRFHAIAIPTFSDHQTPHHREPASTIPAPSSKRSRPHAPMRAHAHESPRPALGQPESSRAVPDPVPDPVTGDPVPETDPVPEAVYGTKSSGAQNARAPRLPDRDDQPAKNVSVITKIVHETVNVIGARTSLSDLTEAVKSRCAQLHIAYDGISVRKAIDSALAQRKHPVEA